MINQLDILNRIAWELDQIRQQGLSSSSTTSSNVNVTNTPLPVSIASGNVSITGPITVSNEVEIKNDTGSPVPVNGTVDANVIFPTTQQVSNNGTFSVQNTTAIPAGTNNIGSITNITGTIPLATNAATDRTLANAPYSNRLSDGTSFYDARQIRSLNNTTDSINSVQSGEWNVNINNNLTNSFHPNPTNYVVENEQSRLNIDSAGNLTTRSAVFTDEGSFRYDFEGSSLYTPLTGTLTVSNVTTDVIGVGTLFTQELGIGNYIKLNSGTDNDIRRVVEIINDTLLIVDSTFNSVSSDNAGFSYVKYTNSSNISYSNSNIIIQSNTSPTTFLTATGINRNIDYSPLIINVKASLSQRIINQTTCIGLEEPSASSSRWFARFVFTGTDNTIITCESAGIKSGTVTASDIETTNTLIPSGLNTSSSLVYRIEVKTRAVLFYINDILIATHTVHIPGQYDLLEFQAKVINYSTVTNTNLTIDYINFNNINEVSVYNPSNNEGFVANNAPVVTYTGSANANNTNLVSIDCNQLRGLFIKFTGTFNATVTFQGDNDANFSNPISIQAIPAAGGNIATSTNTTGTMFNVPVTTRYIRFRTTSYTSGTVNIIVQGLQQESAQNIVTVGNTIAATATQSGTWTMTPVPATTQGFNLNSMIVSAASVNNTLVKNGAGVISNIVVGSPGNSGIGLTYTYCYIKLYNKATAPIAGTDVPFAVYPIISGTTNVIPFPMGLRFSTGIGYAITRNASLLDNTAINAAEVVGTITYI